MKSLVQTLCAMVMLPLALLVWLLDGKTVKPAAGGDQDPTFVFCCQLLSLVPGKFGSFLRVAFLAQVTEYCHRDVYIGFATLFSQRAMRIERGVYIGPQCNIGSCVIAQDALLGSGVHVLSGRNQHALDDLDTPIREQGGEFVQIRIAEDAWIGNQATVMDNIGKQAVVAAGSVVVNAIAERTIVAGNPAKPIKTRG